MAVVFCYHWIILEYLAIFRAHRFQRAVDAVSTRKTDPNMLRVVEVSITPTLGTLRCTRANPNEIY